MRGDMLWIILCIGAAMCYVVVYDAGRILLDSPSCEDDVRGMYDAGNPCR